MAKKREEYLLFDERREKGTWLAQHRLVKLQDIRVMDVWALVRRV